MKAILIANDGQLFYTALDEKYRGGVYQISKQIPMSVAFDQWAQPEPIVYHVRTFQWRGQIVRKNGMELFDFFEEVTNE